jgi:hypothetical protein
MTSDQQRLRYENTEDIARHTLLFICCNTLYMYFGMWTHFLRVKRLERECKYHCYSFRMDALREVPRLISKSDDPLLEAASVSCEDDPQKDLAPDALSLDFLRAGDRSDDLDEGLVVIECSVKKSSRRSRMSGKDGRTCGVGSQHSDIKSRSASFLTNFKSGRRPSSTIHWWYCLMWNMSSYGSLSVHICHSKTPNL